MDLFGPFTLPQRLNRRAAIHIFDILNAAPAGAAFLCSQTIFEVFTNISILPY